MTESTATIVLQQPFGVPVDQWLLDPENSASVKLLSTGIALDMERSVILTFETGSSRKLYLCFEGKRNSGNENLLQKVYVYWAGSWSNRVEVLPKSELETRIIMFLRERKYQSFEINIVKNASTAIELLQNRELPWPPSTAWYLNWGRSKEQRAFELLAQPKQTADDLR